MSSVWSGNGTVDGRAAASRPSVLVTPPTALLLVFLSAVAGCGSVAVKIDGGGIDMGAIDRPGDTTSDVGTVSDTPGSTGAEIGSGTEAGSGTETGTGTEVDAGAEAGTGPARWDSPGAVWDQAVWS